MLVSLNLSNGQWSVYEDENEISQFQVKIGFTGSSPIVNFDKLSFGCKFTGNDSLIFETSFPEDGITYISTDQEYIESFNIKIDYETKCKLSFWAINANKYYDFSYDLFLEAPVELLSDFDKEIEEIFNNAS